MPFDYEALVGHLYIVGGRSISAAPPGTLVEVAPKRAARGREADTFFVMVLPAGQTVAPAAFYEQMCQVSAERYFGSSGSVTAGLRTILNSLNDDLFAHNNAESARYDASILCAVLRGGDLYLARVGAGVALLCHNGELQPFPSDFAGREGLAGAALGSAPAPDIKMAHYEVANGTRLVLSDPNLADLEMMRLSDALNADDIAGVLIALKGDDGGRVRAAGNRRPAQPARERVDRGAGRVRRNRRQAAHPRPARSAGTQHGRQGRAGGQQYRQSIRVRAG